MVYHVDSKWIGDEDQRAVTIAHQVPRAAETKPVVATERDAALELASFGKDLRTHVIISVRW